MSTRHVASLALLALLTACGNQGIGGEFGEKEDGGTTTGSPNIYVSTGTIDFGAVELGAAHTEQLQIQNTGTAKLTIIGSSFDGGSAFSQPGFGSEVPAGGASTVNITFIPTGYGVYEGVFTIQSDDPDQPTITIDLRGQVISDVDGDGHDSEASGGDDCDDDDPEISPSATDRWYDGIDSNCDGADDYDQDGDGFQTDVYNEDPITGGDCQDANPQIHPGADDEWYDGVDSNCDGSDDYDRDGDGWGASSVGAGNDCDDDDPNKNPDASEAFNGIDDNCDDEIDGEVDAAANDLLLTGVVSNDYFGSSLTMGDLDEDGNDDLIVGAYGYFSGRGGVTFYDGSNLPSSGDDFEDGENYFDGTGSTDQLGWYVGYHAAFGARAEAHVSVGAPGYNGNYGAVYVIPGLDAMLGGDEGDSTVIVTGGSTGTSTGYWVGKAVSQGLDLDSDGLEDLLGFYQTSSSSGASPYLWLLHGDASGTFTLSTVDARFSTVSTAIGTSLQRSFPSSGDLDGDGFDDAVYCDYFADTDQGNDGAVWVLWGSATSYSNSSSSSPPSLSTVGTLVSSGDQNERHGYNCGVGDDLDGDGDAELWVYSYGNGNIYVLPGGTALRGTRQDPEDSAILLYEGRANTTTVPTMRPIGDWTGDGISEMALGMGPALNGSADGGDVYVYSSEDEFITSPLSPYSATGDAMATIEGDTDLGHSRFGAQLSGRPGDLNGDGAIDFVAGDYNYSDTSGSSTITSTGAVFITFGSL